MMISAIAGLTLASLGIVNDDRDVIQTAMLSFLKREIWNESFWNPNDLVILSPQLIDKTRNDFSTEFRYLISSLKSEREFCESDLQKSFGLQFEYTYDVMPFLIETSKSLANLLAIEPKIDEGPTYTPPNLISLGSMDWNRKISLRSEYNKYVLLPGERIGVIELIQVSTCRPSYSRNGRYAILKLNGGWGSHGATITLVYERTKTSWERIAHRALFFM